MTSRRVVVTGADGFIGSHLRKVLVRRGETVRAFVFDVVAGDIRDGHARYAASDTTRSAL